MDSAPAKGWSVEDKIIEQLNAGPKNKINFKKIQMPGRTEKAISLMWYSIKKQAAEVKAAIERGEQPPSITGTPSKRSTKVSNPLSSPSASVAITPSRSSRSSAKRKGPDGSCIPDDMDQGPIKKLKLEPSKAVKREPGAVSRSLKSKGKGRATDAAGNVLGVFDFSADGDRSSRLSPTNRTVVDGDGTPVDLTEMQELNADQAGSDCYTDIPELIGDMDEFENDYDFSV